MTITSAYTPANFTGTGSTGPFSASFRVLDKSHIKVERIVIATGSVTTLTEGVGSNQYQATLVAAGLSGVQVTLNTALGNATERLVISRVTPRTQLERLADLKRFNAEIHERAFDKNMMVTQEAEYVGSNAIKFPTADTPGLNQFLPVDILRANKILGFDAQGAPVVTTLTVSDLNGFSTALTQAQTAATTATTAAGTATTQAGIATTQANLAIAAVGSVKASATDTTAANLTTKLTNTGATNILTKTLVNGGGNETLNISVAEASVSQTEGQTDGATAITPRRLPYLLSAVQDAATDLDNFSLGYRLTAASGISNLPPGWSQGRHLVLTWQSQAASYKVQTIYSMGTVGADRAKYATRIYGGSWSSWNTGFGATTSPGPYAIGTAYQWTGPDGTLMFKMLVSSGNVTTITQLDCATGTTNTPTDIVASGSVEGHTSSNFATNKIIQLNFPIKTNEYFKITQTLVAGSAVTFTMSSCKFKPILAL